MLNGNTQKVHFHSEPKDSKVTKKFYGKYKMTSSSEDQISGNSLYLENIHEWWQAQNGPSWKKKATETIKIISKKQGNAHKTELIIKQVLLESHKPITPLPGPSSFTCRGHRLGAGLTHEFCSCTVCRNRAAPKALDSIKTNRLNKVFNQLMRRSTHTQSEVGTQRLIRFKPYNEFSIFSKMGLQ